MIQVNEKYKWYALYVPSNQEKAIKKNIERELSVNNLSDWVERIEVPTDKVFVTIKGKKVVRERVVVPCHIFIKADISNGEVLPLIRKVKNVLGFINPTNRKERNTPEALKESEVEKFFKNTDINKDLKKDYSIGERVRIIDGAFSSFEGVIDQVDSHKKTLRVIVKIFSRETIVDLEYNHVEKIVKVI